MSKQKSNDDYVLLRETIKKKDKVTARSLILNNASVNVPKARGNTPLHWAIIKFEDLEIMTMLLDRGANIHAKNHRYQKPLEVAIENNKIEAAGLLMRRGALVGQNLNVLLLMAIEKNNDTMVKILIDHGIQNDILNDLKCFLNVAISRGQTKIIERILPYYQFSTPSDRYIPREVVIKSDPEYKECLELLLKWNFTVNPNSKDDEDFVYAAVEKGYLSIVLQLLQFGIDVNMMNANTGLNLLKVACLYKHYEVVENLLQHNATVNMTTPTNTDILNNLLINYYKYLFSKTFDRKILQHISCLHIAVLNSDAKMTNLLLRYGATIIDDPTFFNVTRIAAKINCEEIVRLFKDRGVNVNEIDSEGNSLLSLCLNGYSNGEKFTYNMAKFLLDQGATFHIQTPYNSLVFEAIKLNYRNIAKLFLDYNADVQYISPDGDTLLHRAIGNYFDVEFIELLLELNLPVNAVNNKMFTPLHVACQPYIENSLENIEVLLDYNANVNCADHNLMTPLHYACQARHLEIVTVLLKRKANPNAKNKKGETPLHLVCEQNFISLSSSFGINNENNIISTLIQLLLHHNANIEAVDEKGWTPLFFACFSSNEKAVECLLDHHANCDHTDLQKVTPIYVAVQNCSYHSRALEVLLKRKVNVHFIDERGNSMIHIIAETDVSEMVKNLAHTQVNFNSINKEGNTPLHIAVNNRYTDMIENLIKYGANVNILNKNKQTVLQSAMKYMFDLKIKLKYPFLWPMGPVALLHHSNEDLVTIMTTMYDYDEVIIILKIQIIKLKVAGLKVNNQDLKIIYNSDDNEFSDEEFLDEDIFEEDDLENHENSRKIDILRIEVKCEEEIKRMKTESIGVNSITFYNLLTLNIHLLSRFVKNKKIRQTLELEVYDEKFPLYIDIVRSRFRDAKFRYRMMHSAKQYFISNITQRLSDNCIDTVFSYLNIKDLKMFIRAMKLLHS